MLEYFNIIKLPDQNVYKSLRPQSQILKLVNNNVLDAQK